MRLFSNDTTMQSAESRIQSAMPRCGTREDETGRRPGRERAGARLRARARAVGRRPSRPFNGKCQVGLAPANLNPLA
jgi:hypothetical protein